MTQINYRVIVLEDNEILLESYEYYINSFDGYTFKGGFSNVKDALKNYENIYPDIIVSDISMPGINGIDAVQKFREIDSSVKILIISIHDDVNYVLNSFENKVDGYVTKPVDKNTLKKALDDLTSGGAPLSSNISKMLITLLNRKKEKDSYDEDLFSKREIEILKLFTKGYTYKDIADSLFITHSTVSFHIQKIYDKLSVKNKSEAIKKLKQGNS